MKTIKMDRDYSFRVHPVAFQHFRGGCTYERVTEAAAKSIVEAGAGKIVDKAD